MNNETIDISFISLPPSLVAIPSPAFSVLKSYLLHHGINSNIYYVNHSLEHDIDYFKENNTTNTESLLPFIYLLNNNDTKSKYINIYFKSLFPDLFMVDRTLFDDLLKDLIDKYLHVINNVINNIKKNKVRIIGFTSKFGQWIPASVMASYIKKSIPDVKIIIGGWTNKQSAVDFLQLNCDFDYSIWGEGEIPLLSLIRSINENGIIDNIPRLVYRNNQNVFSGINGDKQTYVDFSKKSYFLNFEDYFKSINNVNGIDTSNCILPIEGGRGCNWNKCSFCYLSQGYKYRIKSPYDIVKEIRHQIKTYNCYNFFFTDNDVVGSDVNRFNQFLDLLILLKNDYPHFTIIMAEIISHNIDADTIIKMKHAGFKNVQIGLESISESNLTDINKKQNIIENFFFIKHSISNGINIKGANIIVDTPNETDSMIMESINNIHMYRFVLNSEFNFNIIPLGVSNFSKYLKIIKLRNEEDQWSISELIQIIPEKYYEDIDRFSLLDYVIDRSEKPLWNLFQRLQKYYKRKKYTYKTQTDHENKVIIYKEYVGKKKIKEITIDDYTQYIILTELNSKIHTINNLYNLTNKYVTVDYNTFKTKIDELIYEDIVFVDKLTETAVLVVSI